MAITDILKTIFTFLSIIAHPGGSVNAAARRRKMTEIHRGTPEELCTNAKSK